MLMPVETPVRIQVVGCRADPDPDGRGRWRVTWEVHNDGPEAISLQDAWIPHGRFRGPGHLALSVAVPPGEPVRLEFSVATAGAPGEVVENAFLILQVSSPRAAWRVFARMRVEFDAGAQPRPIVEIVTSQSGALPPRRARPPRSRAAAKQRTPPRSIE